MRQTPFIFRVIVAFLLFCTLIACSTRGDVVFEEYLELELDGVPLVLPAAITALAFDSPERVDTLTVGGRAGEDPRSQGFMFQLSDRGLRPGTYTTDNASIRANYHGEADGREPTTVYANVAGTQFTVTLTTLGADGVRGVFSGTLRRQGDDQDQSLVTVSNGRFAARYHVR